MNIYKVVGQVKLFH